MQVDPFRDLAYQVKTLGGYRAVPVLYQEFHWANYFRDYIPFPQASNLVKFCYFLFYYLLIQEFSLFMKGFGDPNLVYFSTL